MRIPLDYYRILGLPIQATADQLKQAHRDRTLQLPRREYSEVAIEARKALIDEAYGILSDPDQRQSYDRQFLATAHPTPPPEAAGDDEDTGEAVLRSLAAEAPGAPETPTPTIEIHSDQLVGALLILLEMGEYELVIRLGRPYLTSGGSSLEQGRMGDPKRVLADIVLTLALACLELGREQWQQRQYENAAESLETGQELLLRENLFPSIRAELRGDLYKLRPYRILELVARPLEQTPERRQGIKLLKAMLQDRGGIDGAEDDLSGLSTDDFLRFIQQLRGYLTAGEQQEIFEGEARRPSAVAIYLAVYALLARGFAFHQPALIRRAKQLLGRVSPHQDVYLEQAVCALLLGQTEEASRALELSQEYEPLAFIREHSQGAPDRLPGLCLYGERWLREEVFPHFRDLSQHQTGLKDYFADPQVQAALEAMPATVDREAMATPTAAPVERPAAYGAAPSGETMTQPGAPPWTTPGPTAAPLSRPTGEVVAADPTIAERVSQLSPEGRLGEPSSWDDRPIASAPARSTGGQNGHRPPPVGPAVAPPLGRPSRSPHWGRLAGVVGVALLGVGLLGFATLRTLGWISATLRGPRIDRPPLDVGLASPPIAIPEPAPPEPDISLNAMAERAISNWLAAKREAMGESHNIESLEAALAEPALTQWRNRAREGAQNNWYWEYDHAVQVVSVEPDDPSADALVVEAQVQEAADLYQFGQVNTAESYDADLTMRYNLVRQGSEWLVQDMNPVND